MDANRESRRPRRGGGRPSPRARVAIEPLEARDLMAAGGAITDIATLPKGLTLGPMTLASDGHLWFSQYDGTNNPSLAKIAATGTRTSVPLPLGDAGYKITGLAADASGNVWYSLAATAQAPAGSPAGKVGEMTTAGVDTEYALPSATEVPGSIAIGADGDPYIAVSGGPAGPAIDEVTASGTLTERPVKGASGPLTWLTRGPDGNIWFVDATKIGKMTPAGAATEYAVPAPSGGPVDLSNAQLTSGPSGDLWFIMPGTLNKITTGGAVTSISMSGATITSLVGGVDGNLWMAMVPPAGSQLAQTPGEDVVYLTADGKTAPLSDNVDTGTNVVAMASANGALWLDEGGTAVSRVNLATVDTITPLEITPTTSAPVDTNAKKTFYGPIVSFTADIPDPAASDFTATINYGDGYTGTGQVVADASNDGGFQVYGYNTYSKMAFGSQVKVAVNVTGPDGADDEIYGVVDVTSPALQARARRIELKAAAVAAAQARRAAAHPRGPAATTGKA